MSKSKSKDAFYFVWDEEALPFHEDRAIRRSFLTSIESVKVCPPPNRNDLSCYIHGQISFTDDPNKPPVTLFDLPEDDPESIILGHPDFGFLTLSDNNNSDRPLCVDHKLIFVNLKLFEEGVEIADVENFKYEIGSEGEGVTFAVETHSKFTVEVTCAVVFGVRVQVEVRRISDDSDSSTTGQVIPSKRNRAGQRIPQKLPMWGRIAACQHFGMGEGKSRTITLNYRFDNEPMMVEIGSPIPLDRKVVIAPAASRKMFLSVALALANIESKEVPNIVDDSVPFPINYLAGTGDPANRQLTCTKKIPDTKFSLSITLIH